MSAFAVVACALVSLQFFRNGANSLTWSLMAGGVFRSARSSNVAGVLLVSRLVRLRSFLRALAYAVILSM